MKGNWNENRLTASPADDPNADLHDQASEWTVAQTDAMPESVIGALDLLFPGWFAQVQDVLATKRLLALVAARRMAA